MGKKKIGVVLSGCGVQDGSEIHEAVLTLLAIDRAGGEAVCFAPDIGQADVIDHATGKPSREKRNVLSESARISRGAIRPLGEADAAALDAVILPGGFGAAKNLSDFAAKGNACSVNTDLSKLLARMHRAKKPIGAWCISPALLAKALGQARPRLTIGTDAGTARSLEAMGAVHETKPATGVSVDEENRIVTTPCYMLAGRISEVADGISSAVAELFRLCAQSAARSG